MRAEQRLCADGRAPAVEAPKAPLIAHIIYRLGVGGLENGLVNLINRIPAQRYRHAIICLKDSSDFRLRLRSRGVPIFVLDKPDGNSLLTQIRIWRLLRKLRPDIVHTRNLAALESTVAAMFAGVAVRVHGEHGRDVGDLDGSNRGRQRVRRLFKPFVSRYIALSKDLERYLHDAIDVPADRVSQLYNGVDTEHYRPAVSTREPLPHAGFAEHAAFVVGTVGRMQEVKDQLTLARAFVQLSRLVPPGGRPLRLVMVGDGPLRARAAAILTEAGIGDLAWFAGERDDVAEIMRGLDLFVLPSLAEGISNTILEAMASGLPVIATAVGGNPELVREGRTGALVPAADPEAMARAMMTYYSDAEIGRAQGRAARSIVEREFGMAAMIDGYLAIYDRLLAQRKTGRIA